MSPMVRSEGAGEGRGTTAYKAGLVIIGASCLMCKVGNLIVTGVIGSMWIRGLFIE